MKRTSSICLGLDRRAMWMWLDFAHEAQSAKFRFVLGRIGLLAFVCAVCVMAALSQNISQSKIVEEHSQSNGDVGNRACAHCHATIFDSYSQTPMAHASGPATENLMPADFTHAKSGVHYRIYEEDGKAWLSFERKEDASPERAISGKRELLYAIGSGRRGRTYLFSVDNFFFESPVNWYADRRQWDMAPAYGDVHEIPLNLPAYSECLRCHTSGMHRPENDTENQYAAPLFAQDGVGCERCHGPGATHVQGGAIVNPVKLAPQQRDAICMQCHLEASVGIERTGKHVADFRAGENLDDYIRHFVLTSTSNAGLGANSQFEALAQSKCKQKSGDAMSCMSCHDPHTSPAAEQRPAYFRGKCLACHGDAFGAKHHPENNDCTACHMPASSSRDIAHVEVTDHRIRKRPQVAAQLLQDSAEAHSSKMLAPFPNAKDSAHDNRDLALAWQSLAEGGMPEASVEAERLLPLALKESPIDPAVLTGLAFVELKHGDLERARELYRKALAFDPRLIDAAANLGVIEAREGHFGEAARLWKDAFDRAPGKSSIGMNLARTYCEAGKITEARAVAERVLRFNPDLGEARKLLSSMNRNPADCGN